MTSFLLVSVRRVGDADFAAGFRDPAGRVVEFGFAVREVPTSTGFPVREILPSAAFEAAVDARARDDTWLGRVMAGFDGLRVEGWQPETVAVVDIQQHRVSLSSPEGTEVVVDVSVPYHGADSHLNTVRPEGSVTLPDQLTRNIADLVRFFDMQSIDLLEIEA